MGEGRLYLCKLLCKEISCKGPNLAIVEIRSPDVVVWAVQNLASSGLWG
jgi:hypothetical protein